jgi:hypothetical protein
LLIALLGLLLMGRTRRVHERWISCRFLAERLRASLFAAAAGIDVVRNAGSEQIFPIQREERWLRRAMDGVWLRRPGVGVPASPQGIRRFVVEGWIEDQLKYFDASAGHHEVRLRQLERASVLLFGLTLLFATLHGFEIGEATNRALSWSHLIALATIALPAFGVALSGIKTQRDFTRNSLRFVGMRSHLARVRLELEDAGSLDEVQRAVGHLDRSLLEENRDLFLATLIHARMELTG